ncbi:hypothetical protein ACFV4G_37850 [Kitasatospora sp. NPDC059747]|uniref:hypothetical protein n=1 Tax=Kitasatospora sp. NPDC059747 TaxID=3346930 RepID=UPI003651CABF
MTSAPITVDAGVWGEAARSLTTALGHSVLVSVERFTTAGRTTYTGPFPLEAARPALAIGCYRPWPEAAPLRVLAAESGTRVRGIAQRRNWMTGIDRPARSAIAALDRPVIISAWYGTDLLRSWAGPRGVVAAIEHGLRARIEDKAYFGELLLGAQVPAALRLPGVRVDGPLPGLAELRRRVGAVRLVVQCGADSGGRGTVFVDDEPDLARAARMPGPYRVTAFTPGWSSNVTVLSVPDHRGALRVYVDRPSHKAVGVPEAGIGPGKSAGNCWSLPWPEPAAAAVVDAAERVARWAWRRHGMSGLFGLDAILTDDGRAFLNEINCRNQGTTEVSAVNQQLRGLPPFVVVHLTTLLGGRVDWLPDPDDFNAATVRAAASTVPGPYYLKLRHRGQTPVVLDQDLARPGRYRVHGGRLRWVGPGAHPAEAATGEVLLANLPEPGVLCLPGAELGTAEAVTPCGGGPFAGPHRLSPVGRALLSALDQHLIPTDLPTP